MRRLLVTGGAGFIGTNFVRYWAGKYPADRMVVLDALTYAGNVSNLDAVKEHPGFRFVQGDICDDSLVNNLMTAERLDTIVHFAAESHVDRSITGPDAFIRTNVVGTHTLLKAAKHTWLDDKTRSGPCRFHHVSTDEVYGSLGSGDSPFTEQTPYAPNSPYSASKAASDHLVRAYHHTYGLPVTISNCSNNYGPYHFPEKLIPLVILNALEGKPLPLYGDGRNVRDWLYVEDHCCGIECVLQKGRVGEVYNIGGSSERQNAEVVRKLCALLDEFKPRADDRSYCEQITFVPDRPGHDRRYAMDTHKIASALGWSARETFDSGMRKTVQWYIANLRWCMEIRNTRYAGDRLGLIT